MVWKMVNSLLGKEQSNAVPVQIVAPLPNTVHSYVTLCPSQVQSLTATNRLLPLTLIKPVKLKRKYWYHTYAATSRICHLHKARMNNAIFVHSTCNFTIIYSDAILNMINPTTLMQFQMKLPFWTEAKYWSIFWISDDFIGIKYIQCHDLKGSL